MMRKDDVSQKKDRFSKQHIVDPRTTNFTFQEVTEDEAGEVGRSQIKDVIV